MTDAHGGADDGLSTVGLTTAAARAILGEGYQPAGRADQVAHRLGQAIRLGMILDGERLPPEPQLAEQLGIAPVTLREALATLRERGLVQTRRGRGGGTFATAAADDQIETLSHRLEQLTLQDIRDLGDHRRAISGTAARLAAERALPEEIEDLRRQVDRLHNAISRSERRRADTQFTIEVAAAAQSSRLTHEELRLRAEVGDLLCLQLTESDHSESVRSRRRLVAAISERKSGAAGNLAERHVARDTERLFRLRLDLYDSDGRPAGKTPAAHRGRAR